MRLPNGFGGVSKLPGNRRKPYRARITVSFDTTTGKQTYRTIGYYETREEAISALADYHASPDKYNHKETFAEVYDAWSEDHFQKIGIKQTKNIELSFRICEPIHQIRFGDLRLDTLQRVIDQSGKNLPMLEKVKSLLIQMYSYAMSRDIVQKNYASYIDLTKHEPKDHEDIHKIFTTDEIRTLWQHTDNQDIRIILILICTGVRIGELLHLKKEEVHLGERWFAIREAKTESGIRIVPIASVILPFVEDLMQIYGDYLVPNSLYPDDPLNYEGYLRNHFKKPLKKLGMDHKPHDTRYSFISILTSAKVLPVVIKRIVGHKTNDVTEKVYTKFEIQQLVSTIDAPNYRDPYIVEKLVL